MKEGSVAEKNRGRKGGRHGSKGITEGRKERKERNGTERRQEICNNGRTGERKEVWQKGNTKELEGKIERRNEGDKRTERCQQRWTQGRIHGRSEREDGKE